MYIRVDNALTIPRAMSEAFPNPVYLCLSRTCAVDQLPVRTNIYRERVPTDVILNENCLFCDGDSKMIIAAGFSVI